MNVLVPYVRLHPAVVDALARDRIAATFVETAGPDGYLRALTEAWAQGEAFIVLEQDKVPAQGVLADLWGCSHAWCSAKVGMRGTLAKAPYPSLSCVKFGARLMEVWPELMRDVGRLDLGLGEGEWSRLDLGIAGLLSGIQGWSVHWHSGVVEHLHEEVAA